MKIITQVIQFLVGGLFIFSGLIKLNDPTGMQIKLEEYFEVFAQDKLQLGLAGLSGLWHILEPYSLSLSLLLSTLEVGLGVALLLKYKPVATLWALWGTIVFFTFLTFYSAYFNKVTDCGCFGDFIKLTPWTSFTKDVILFIAISFLIFNKNHLPANPSKFAFWGSNIASFGALFLGIWATWHLPYFDFLPYKVGANIANNMKPSAELKYGEAEYIYIDLKTKNEIVLNQKAFEKEAEKKYADTLKYAFKEYKRPLLNPEALPKINSFSVSNPEGNDMTQEVFTGEKLLVIIPQINRTNLTQIPALVSLARALEKKNIKTIVLNGDVPKEFEGYRHATQLALPYGTMDKSVLKTMIRASVGLIYLKDANVLQKWNINDLPNEKYFGK